MVTESVDGAGTARALLQLEQVGERRFRSVFNQDNHSGTIFGGQAPCQALAAAQRTVAGWPVHSCTGYFLRGGAIDKPIEYEVELVRDGRRYASRRVLGSQSGHPIFDFLCSFHDPENGFQHRVDAVMDMPMPEDLPDVRDFTKANAHRLPKAILERNGRTFPIELRSTDSEQFFFGEIRQPRHDYWFCMPTAAEVEGAADHACLVTFMSDYWMAGTAGSMRRPQPDAKGRFSVATVNHSLWFHAPVRVDDWLLFRTESPWSGEGRGLVRAFIYDRRGELKVSVVQEVSMRTG